MPSLAADGQNLRVFVVDDHDLVRRGLSSLLNEEPGIEVVGEAASGKEALLRIPEASVDVAILDVRLPDQDGIAVCREVLSMLPEIRCLVLTAYEDDESLFAAIMAGASGYLLKDANADELVEAVRKVGDGGSLLDPALTEQVLHRLREGPDYEDERLGRLTAQERRILTLIAEGLTNRQIAEHVYLAEATVKNYVSNLLAKLGLHGRTQAAIFATEMRQRRREASE
jgi:two-component system response regulator DevR